MDFCNKQFLINIISNQVIELINYCIFQKHVLPYFQLLLINTQQ